MAALAAALAPFLSGSRSCLCLHYLSFSLCSTSVHVQFRHNTDAWMPGMMEQAVMLTSIIIPSLVFIYMALYKSPRLVRCRSTYLVLLRLSIFLVFFLYPAVYKQYFSLTLTPTIGGLVSHILRLVSAQSHHILQA